MARALVVQHTAQEGLGNLLQWLPAAGLDVHPIHPYLGHRVPPSVEGDALIVLGGPMGAYDDAEAPWLPATRALLSTAVDDGVPTIGICLGAQLLAVAAGGEVQKGSAGPELGLGQVDVPVGDELLSAGSMPVVQWHYDAVTRMPDGAELLASTEAYRAQALRVGGAGCGRSAAAAARGACSSTSKPPGGWSASGRSPTASAQKWPTRCASRTTRC